jgi:periplasmic glucans biosynthesis protein
MNLRSGFHAPPSFAVAATTVTVLFATAGGTATADPAYAKDGSFNTGTVAALAQDLASKPYAAPKSGLPDVLARLDYDGYRDIRPNPSATIWLRDKTQFRVQVMSRGFLFVDPVELALVSDGTAHHLAYSPDLFTTGQVMKSPLPKDDVGFSGFRVLSPINRATVFDEICVFQGASYFRAVGAKESWGLSARGLANKTAEPDGEEFPVFRAFWIERPPQGGQMLRVFALLDSPSVAGAYTFRIHPGNATTMDVDAVLFPRTGMSKAGIAPMTSMYLFSGNGRHNADDFRPEVHDSDGLLIFNGRGERLWRPLSNPRQLEVSAFVDNDPRGFGLLQRARNPAVYQDFEAQYERRPSLWVEPIGSWGQGAVVLTEIPSDAEIHDNIVVFWRPKEPLSAGKDHHVSYRLTWGDQPKLLPDRARIVATRRGRADVKVPTPVRRFVVDYAVSPSTPRPTSLPKAAVTTSAGKIGDIVVSDNPLVGGIRLSFTFDPKDAKAAELRAELTFDDRRTAETWIYRWTPP